MQLEYLSASRLGLFDTCPMSFKEKYINKTEPIDETTEFYADYGKLFHDIMEKSARKEINPFQAFVEYDSNFKFCYIPPELSSDYYEKGKEAIKRKVEEVQNLKILGVEKEFKHVFDISAPYLYGFIDLIYEDEYGIVIRDYKTSKPYTPSQVKKSYQPAVYTLAALALFGKDVYKFEFDFPLYDKKIEMVIDESFVRLAYLKLTAVWKRLQRSGFEADYSPFFCEAFCAYNSICPAYLKKVNKN